MSMKKIGVAVVLMMCAVSAMATNFRAADQVYVPAAGKIGSFASDIFISNVNSFPVTVSVIFSQGTGGSQQTFANLFTLAANERREFVDFIGTAQPNGLGLSNALGQIIFNGCKQGADCGPATQSPDTGISPNFADISVESRIYSSQGTATTGQLFSGYPWYNFVSQDQQNNGLDSVFITGIRQNTNFRANIGLANASQFSNTTMVVRLFSGNGVKFGSDFLINLAPLGHTQQNITNMFPGFTGSGFYVTVSQINSSATQDSPSGCGSTGCAGFYAYGSVLDNQTNDATTLEPQYNKSLTSSQIACIYPSPDQPATCKSVAKMRRAARH
jgi:hypothetical protein